MSKTRPITVAELIDYLEQYPADTFVFANAADVPRYIDDQEFDGYIVLDHVDCWFSSI
jgi:hypothetical protein